MLIEHATAEVHSARRRHQREIAERNRYRRLIKTIDSLIEACEETHLQHIKECPGDLRASAHEVLTKSSSLVSRGRDEEAARVVAEQAARQFRKVTELMDALWIVQEVVFDLMLPWRSELPEDVELPGVPMSPWRYDSAA